MRNRILFLLLLLALPVLLFAQTPSNPTIPHEIKIPKPRRRSPVRHRHRYPRRHPAALSSMSTSTSPTRSTAATSTSIPSSKGNLGAEFFSIWVEPTLYKGQYARRTLELIDSVKQQVARHPDQMSSSPRPRGIEQAHRDHKLAALMGIEGGHSIEDSHRPAAPVLRARRALHDPHLVQLQRLGRQLRRHRRRVRPAHQRGPDRVRQRRGLRDEPAGHDGRYLPRLRPHLLSHPGHQPRAGHRLALLGARPLRRSAQHDRRHAARRGPLRRSRLQGRRRPGQLLLRLPLAGLSRRAESPRAGR